METIKLPADFYKNLYESIMNEVFNPENEYDNSRDMEFEIGNLSVSLTANFDIEEVDDSFSHEFGVEECHHYEATNLDNIEDLVICHYNDELDKEEDVTELFSYEEFSDAVNN